MAQEAKIEEREERRVIKHVENNLNGRLLIMIPQLIILSLLVFLLAKMNAW